MLSLFISPMKTNKIKFFSIMLISLCTFNVFPQNLWFDTESSYLKIYIEEEGICRLDYNLLSKYIYEIDNIDPVTFKVLNKGTEIPVFVHGENDNIFNTNDYVEFVVKRLEGENSRFNLFSKYNVYWLTWGNGSGTRVNIVDAYPYDQLNNGNFYIDTLHYEEENYYYYGSTATETQNTFYIQGEGWYTVHLYPDEDHDMNFKLSGIEKNVVDSVEFNALVRGIAEEHNMGKEHFVDFYLNGTLIGRKQFWGYVDTLFSFNIDVNLLNNGQNTLKFTSVKVETDRDVVLLDWFKIVYPRLYVFESPGLKFATAQNNETYIEFNNLISNNAVIYNYSGNSKFDNFIYEADESKYLVKLNLPTNDSSFYIFQTDSLIIPDSIKQVNFQDFYNTENQGKYLILTHNKFIESAAELAQYRSKEIKTKTIDIEEIYNEFNYGIPNPYAIREFFKTAYSIWSIPPEYAVLLGDANSDNWNEKNFIPSFGYPCSDGWFTSIDNDDDIIPNIIIGRIPVKSKEEADNYIDKIKEYESKDYEKWNKNIIFLNGGHSDYERDRIRSHNVWLIKNNIAGFPFGGKAKSYDKTNNSKVDYTFIDEIIDDFKEGILILNAFGHAAQQRYDIDFGNPSDLQNKGKYPLIIGWSCRTALFNAHQTNSSAESYTLIKDKGSIGYIGTTGWGNVQMDEFFSVWFYQALFKNGKYRPAEALIIAKDSLAASWNTDAAINTILQYNYIGDPYLKLKIPDVSDFAMEINPKTELEFPTERIDTLKTYIYIKNYGILSDDSVLIELKTKLPENLEQISYQKYLSSFFTDTIEFKWEIKGATGEHTLDITVDPFNEIIELDENNNILTFRKRVYKESLVIEKPLNYSIVKADNVALEVSLPKNFPTEDGTIYFQIDTTKEFLNPIHSSGPVTEGNLLTKYEIQLDNDQRTYFWRVRREKDDIYSNWSVGRFFTSFEEPLVNDIIITGKFFDECESENLNVSNEITLDNDFIRFVAGSAGFDDGNTVNFTVNNVPVKVEYYDSTALARETGIAITVIDSIGEIKRTSWFNTYSYSSHNNALIEFIENVEEGLIVLAGIKDTGARYLNTEGRYALQSIGSRYAFDIGFRDSWAIIGRKGAPVGSVTEAFKKWGQGAVSIMDSIAVSYNTGTLTLPVFNQLKSFDKLAWQGDNVNFTVSGYNKILGYRELLSDTLTNSQGSDISLINTYTHEDIKFTASFSKTDNATPILEKVLISGEKAGDAVTNFSLISTDRDSVLEGDDINVSVGVLNAGYSSYDSLLVRLNIISSNGDKLDEKDKVLQNLEPDSIKYVPFRLNTRGFKGRVLLSSEINPGEKEVEISYENNFASGYIFVKSDTVSSTVYVTVDGKRILNGDFISSEPEIFIEITDNSYIGIIDTSGVDIFIDEVRIGFEEIQFDYNAADKKAVIQLTPVLSGGIHILRLEFKDVSGNSGEYELEFRVENELKIYNVFNYPNPFRDDTYFTFVLTQPAESVRIKIYTVLGRLIKVIDDYGLLAGYNKIHWDGRDEDGDRISNSVYLYKIIAKNNDKTTEAQNKLVIMR